MTKPFHSVAVYQLEWFDLSRDYYKICSSILRYYYTILNIHYKLLLMKIFLLLQSSYFCRFTSKSSNVPYKVCSPILRYDCTILNTHYKLYWWKYFYCCNLHIFVDSLQNLLMFPTKFVVQSWDMTVQFWIPITNFIDENIFIVAIFIFL